MTFEERIQQGLDNKFQGLDNGFKRLNKYIFGVQKGVKTLIGGGSGSGKTSLVDYMLICALEDAERKNIEIFPFYYCFEIREPVKKANWLSTLIYKEFKKVIAPEVILGLGDNRLNKEEQEMVKHCLPKLNRLWNKIRWVFEATNPTGIYFEIRRFCEARGTFVKEPYIDEHGNKKERIVKYIANNSDELVIGIIDHFALMKLELEYNLKQNMDKMSEYTVILSNLFGVSWFILQQFNSALSNIERIKYSGVDLSPVQSDFKDSTSPYQDADVVIGLLNAYKMGLAESLGYDIDASELGLKHRYRMLKVIKNRLSRDDIYIGLLFHPEAGRFKELPPIKGEGKITRRYYEEVQKL